MTLPLVTGRLAAHAGLVTEQTGAEVRSTTADAARQARAVLAGLTDPESELTATPATRNRLEGVALAGLTRWPLVTRWRRLQVEHRLTGERGRTQGGMLGEYTPALAPRSSTRGDPSLVNLDTWYLVCLVARGDVGVFGRHRRPRVPVRSDLSRCLTPFPADPAVRTLDERMRAAGVPVQ